MPHSALQHHVPLPCQPSRVKCANLFASFSAEPRPPRCIKSLILTPASHPRSLTHTPSPHSHLHTSNFMLTTTCRPSTTTRRMALPPAHTHTHKPSPACPSCPTLVIDPRPITRHSQTLPRSRYVTTHIYSLYPPSPSTSRHLSPAIISAPSPHQSALAPHWRHCCSTAPPRLQQWPTVSTPQPAALSVLRIEPNR